MIVEKFMQHSLMGYLHLLSNLLLCVLFMKVCVITLRLMVAVKE